MIAFFAHKRPCTSRCSTYTLVFRTSATRFFRYFRHEIDPSFGTQGGWPLDYHRQSVVCLTQCRPNLTLSLLRITDPSNKIPKRKKVVRYTREETAESRGRFIPDVGEQ